MRARGLNLQISSKSKTIDFEEKLYDLDQAENRLRTVDAFINTDGGHYYIGIKDDGKALGLNKTMVNEQVQLFHRNVKEHISPLPRYEFIYHEIEKDIFVIEILITKSIELPVLLTFHGIPSIYVREEGRNRPASRNEIVNLVLASKVESFDDVLTDEIFDKNNFNILFDTYKKQNDEPLTDKKLISNLFMNEDKLLKTGSILFKDDYKGNDTSLKITKRNGLSKGENAFKNLLDIHENIISSINKAFGVIKENIGYIEQKEYFGRKTIYDYPLSLIFLY